MREYKELSDTQSKLLEQNRIDILGEIDEDMHWYVREVVVRLSTRPTPPPLVIHFTSQGGRIDFGLHIFDLLKYYPGKKFGVVHGMAASMAAILLQVCDVRLCTPNSLLLIHHLIRNQIKFDVFKDKQQLNKLIKELEESQGKLNKIFKSRTGQHMRRIEQISKEDREMSAEEALQFGLIDAIVETNDEVKKYVDGKTVLKQIYKSPLLSARSKKKINKTRK